MSLYIPQHTTPIVPNAMTRIERRLPHPGEVTVREGTRVEPDDIVARAFLPTPRQVINVAQTLAIPPSHVQRAMRYEEGSTVAQGDDIAQGAIMSGARSCKAPVRGIISAIDTETGYVTIAPEPTEYTLAANIRGVVMQEIPYKGVIIETLAAQVYGVFGIGSERSGVLQLFVTDPDQVVTPENIDVRSAYTILIGGSGITAAALKKAVQVQVRGIIVGGIDERELRTFLQWRSHIDWQTGITSWQLPNSAKAADPGLTLMVTEGFGVRPMSHAIFELLSSRDRQEALIEGTTQLRSPMRRPRLVISVARSAEAQLEPPSLALHPNATVRLLDYDHLGQIATVRSTPTVPQTIPSGVHTVAVEVEMHDGTTCWLPYTAVEVLP